MKKALLLALIAVSDAPAGEWEDIRESYGNTLRTYEKRIGEIEARERGVPDQYGNVAFGEIGRVDANVTTYPDGGLASNTTYAYRVRATNTGGASGRRSRRNIGRDSRATLRRRGFCPTSASLS